MSGIGNGMSMGSGGVGCSGMSVCGEFVDGECIGFLTVNIADSANGKTRACARSAECSAGWVREIEREYVGAAELSSNNVEEVGVGGATEGASITDEPTLIVGSSGGVDHSADVEATEALKFVEEFIKNG